MKDASHQLDFLAGGLPEPKPPPKTRKQNRKPPAQPAPSLPLKERRYLPVAGVPRTRGDCPDTTHDLCPFVRCRYNLFRVDASDRAGRPGLANVPRDERGHTIATPGTAGTSRPGTTLWPAWLELERTCKVVINRDENGVVADVDTYVSPHLMTLRVPSETGEVERIERHIGTWEDFREHTRDGEPLQVFNDSGELCGAATLGPDGIRFRYLMNGYVVVLRRVRGVPSCALDEADKGPRTNEQIGQATGRHRTLVARIVRRGAGKVKAAGCDVGDLMDI